MRMPFVAAVALLSAITFTSSYSVAAHASAAETVYITKSGDKYHSSGCRYLRKSKIAIDLADAKKQGYRACSVCAAPR